MLGRIRTDRYEKEGRQESPQLCSKEVTMRLIELKEKIRNTRIPRAIYHEIMAQEVDTIGPDSPQEKQMLADQMMRAQQSGTIYKVPLTTETQTYLLKKSMPSMIDIARDNMNGRLVNSLQKFQAKLHAKLVGAN